MRMTMVMAGLLASACGGRAAAPAPTTSGAAAPGQTTASTASTAAGGVDAPEIDPGVLRGLMTAGALKVDPDEALAAAIAAHGTQPLETLFTVCLDASGSATIELWQASELPAFDRAAAAVTQAWRFRPYVRDGVPSAACSHAEFRHAVELVPQAPGLPPPPPGWDEALPPARIELPRGIVSASPLAAGLTTKSPTPGVVIANVCRLRGAREAPSIALLQSSGDRAFDAGLLDRRETAPVDEADDRERVCALWSAIQLPPRADVAVAHDEPEGDPGDPDDLEPRAFEAQRIAGEPRIFPAEDVKRMIHAAGVDHLLVAIKVCVDPHGRVEEIRVLRSSGYLGYDADLVNGIATWGYRPFTIDGRPQHACGMVSFNYRQT